MQASPLLIAFLGAEDHEDPKKLYYRYPKHSFISFSMASACLVFLFIFRGFHGSGMNMKACHIIALKFQPEVLQGRDFFEA